MAHKHMTKTVRRQWKWSFLGEILSKGTTVLTSSSPRVGADSLLTTWKQSECISSWDTDESLQSIHFRFPTVTKPAQV